MDFFEHQERARRRTKSLVLYFVLSVVLTISAIYLVLAAIFLRPRSEPLTDVARLWNWELFLAVGAVTSLVILCGSLLKIRELSQGGGTLAMRMGGRQINPHTSDPDERKLMNVVEEMAIASGVPVPAVFVLEEQKSINAFAAGFSSGDAVVGVTKGCMRLLTRDELQGVIAHEFSHILNGDMRLNMRLIGIVYGILCLTLVGRVLLRVRGRKNPAPLVGLVLIVMGWIGFFFGRLIKAAVSRQREFLADAAAVQFTRNPDGLSGALKKIGGLTWGSRVSAENAEETSHLFFGDAVGSSSFSLWATHPPLDERIRRIDPKFEGKFPRVVLETEARAGVSGSPMPAVRPVKLTAQNRAGSGSDVAASAATLLATLGAPTIRHLNHAGDLLASLPETLRQAAHEPFDANALVYSLLLSCDESTRREQLTELEAQTLPALLQTTTRLWPQTAELGRQARLALVELSIPALRRLAPEQYDLFARNVGTLIESDRGIDLFEYALQKMLGRHLQPHFRPANRAIVQYYVLKPVIHDCDVLLSAVAHFGQDERPKIESAFQAGVAALEQPQYQFALLDRNQCNLAQIDKALDHLAQLAPPLKKAVLNACAHAAASDGVLQSREVELVRAIADTFDCPIPPFVPIQTT